MTRKPVTDATKAKLPKPRKRKQCPRCEKMILVDVPDIHTCYDAKALREELLREVGTVPAPDFRVVPCMDWPADSLPSGDPTYTFTPSYIPPNTESYPWPVRVLNWLDNAQFWTRQRVANALRRMAARIAP